MATAKLKYFQPTEFHNYALVDEMCAYWLDKIRGIYGSPLYVCSDYRSQEENAKVGGSPSSLHLRGRAFDLAWITSEEARYRFLQAALTVAATAKVELELEFVLTGPEQHIHLGFFPAGHVGKLELRVA